MNTSFCQLSPASPVLDLPVQPQLTDQPCLLIADLFTSPIPDLPQGALVWTCIFVWKDFRRGTR